MKEILLNTINKKSLNYKKFVALIDDEDYQRISKHNWSVAKRPHTLYAVACINGKLILLHNFLIEYKGIDHIDGNGLNNQRSNLRKANPQQNVMNMKSNRNTSSKFKGVIWHKKNRKWMSQIQHNQKSIYLGYFTSELEAAKAYNEKAKELFGEFAKLNEA